MYKVRVWYRYGDNEKDYEIVNIVADSEKTAIVMALVKVKNSFKADII